MTGLPFDSVRRTEWGLIMMCEGIPMSFCFRFEGGRFECGIPGLLTPGVDKVVDFLRGRGYELGALKSLGHEVIEKRITTYETSGEWR